jgi:TPR repeat protein
MENKVYSKKEIAQCVEAAKRGDAYSQNDVGFWYEHGCNDFQVDLEKAVYWYTKSAESGFALAQYNLAVCYANRDWSAGRFVESGLLVY